MNAIKVYKSDTSSHACVCILKGVREVLVIRDLAIQTSTR